MRQQQAVFNVRDPLQGLSQRCHNLKRPDKGTDFVVELEERLDNGWTRTLIFVLN
jgi:hypothetical protein